jgi:predicted O-methyltransferase YrrM
MIELGTSLGISSMYQAAGNPDGRLITLEGCPETANAARRNFKGEAFTNIEVITGNFDSSLPALLKELKQVDYVYIDGNHTLDATLNYFRLLKKHVNSTSVLVFDDIYWSEGMQKAWREIVADPDTTVTIDFYQFGLVFFNKDLTRQAFRLRL